MREGRGKEFEREKRGKGEGSVREGREGVYPPEASGVGQELNNRVWFKCTRRGGEKGFM